jgi:hypothetical protein
MTRSLTIQSSHKKALKEAFRTTPLGVTTANQANYDIILEIRHIRTLLRSDLQFSSGQTTVERQDHPLRTTILSTAFLDDPSPENYKNFIETTPISHVITVVHDGKALTGDIRSTIQEFEYNQPIQATLQKYNSWSADQFRMVDWAAFFLAIKWIPRSHRVSITKLSHQIWNTNSQNHRLYIQSASCPLCHYPVETPSHVLKCPHSSAVSTRKLALAELTKALQVSTPQLILEAVLSGLHQWAATDYPSTIKAPTSGSKLPSLQSVTSAFDIQTSIGWDSFLRGHKVSAWKASFAQHYRPKKPLTPQAMEVAANKWLSLVILSVWTYSEKLWKYRNQVVHGQTEISRISRALTLLHDRVRSLYKQFEEDPFMLPQSRRYLFNRPLPATLQMDHDGLAAWIRSVDEGLLTRAHMEKLEEEALKRTLHQFLTPRSRSVLSRPNRPASIWRPPFSVPYYKTHGIPVIRKKNLQIKLRQSVPDTLTTSRLSRKLRKRSRATGPIGSRRLMDFGFTVIRNNRQSHAPVGKKEFSGTKLSTAP